jgi:hypothetical protein
VSGSKAKRPILEAAIERVEAGKTAGIVVARLDRLARLIPSERIALLERVEAAGGIVLSASENIDASTPEAVLPAMCSWAWPGRSGNAAAIPTTAPRPRSTVYEWLLTRIARCHSRGYSLQPTFNGWAYGATDAALLGLIVLPFTTLVYALVWIPGVHLGNGRQVWVAIAFVIELVGYGGNARANRGRVARP